MIDESDDETRAALRELIRTTAGVEDAFVLWVGAGVSRWNGYPGWEQLASTIDRQFRRECPPYEAAEATAALATRDYPRVFSLQK